MELHQTLSVWLRCVTIWEMPWADPHGCQYLILHSKQSLEKVLLW